MKVGGIRKRKSELQLRLFDDERALKTMGAARNFVGEFFEEVAAAMFDVKRIKEDTSADICPDLKVDDNAYLECKSIGNSGQGLIYVDRYKKDRKFCKEGNSIGYLFFKHKFEVAKARSLEQLREGLAVNLEHACLIESETLRKILRKRPLRKLNSKYMKKSGVRNGWGNYGRGWAFPYSEILNECSIPMVCHLKWKPYGVELKSVRLHKSTMD